MTKEEKSLIIDNHEIQPGDFKSIEIPVGNLPSGTNISINVNVYRSMFKGPVVLVLAGVHGDEINGVEIVRRTIVQNIFGDLTKGTVIVIPLLNVFGFINFSRDVPDGKDVNRSFPGTKSGSLASRVAYTLTKKILPNIDFGIDFHTGGGSRYNFPQIRFGKTNRKARELAMAFSPPFIIEKPYILKSLRKVAKDMKIPIIVFEGGEATRLDGFSISKGVDGLKRVLKHVGMLENAPDPEPKVILLKKTSWIRAPYSGLFTWTRKSGVFVHKGEPLGEVNDVAGTKSVTVLSNKDGYIIGHNNASVVSQGDALFHVGYESERV
jgi:predicted deacylase